MKKTRKNKPMYALQLWRGIDKQWYWHIISTVNGQIILTSEGYKSKRKAKQTIQNWLAGIIGYGLLFEELDLA